MVERTLKCILYVRNLVASGIASYIYSGIDEGSNWYTMRLMYLDKYILSYIYKLGKLFLLFTSLYQKLIFDLWLMFNYIINAKSLYNPGLSTACMCKSC